MNPSYRGAEFNNYYPSTAQHGQPSPGQVQSQHNHMQPGFIALNNHPPHPPPPPQSHPNAYIQQQLPRHQHPPHPSMSQSMTMHHHPHQIQQEPQLGPMMNSRTQMRPSPIQHSPPMHHQSPAPVQMQHNNQVIGHLSPHPMPSMHHYHPAQQPPPPQPIPQPTPPHHLSSPMQNHHHHHHHHQHQQPPHVAPTPTPPGHYIHSPTMINQQQPQQHVQQHPQSLQQQQPIHHHHHHQQHHQHQQQPPPLPPPNQHHSRQTPGLERASPFVQNISQTEIRIMEINKRLTHRPRTKLEKPIPDGPDQSIWWQKFASDFFDDDCMIALRVRLDDRLVEFTIGRTLIPKFFRTYFDGGVDDLYIKLRDSREITQADMITLDCEQTLVITKNIFYHSDYNTTINALVHTEGHLTLDFRTDSLLIKTWRFHTTHCNEFIDRTFTGTFGHDGRAPNTFLVDSVTNHGLPTKTLSYLKMCQVIEPMQSLMSLHKQTQMEPRACLKTLLHDKYKVKNLEDTRAPPTKRRKRKTPNAATGTVATTKKSKANVNNANIINNNNNSTINTDSMMSNSPLTSETPNMISSQDALVEGEPTMLSTELGDENERKITRLANNQFEADQMYNNNLGVELGDENERKITRLANNQFETNQMYNSNTDSNSATIDQSLDCNSLIPHGQGQSKCNSDTVIDHISPNETDELNDVVSSGEMCNDVVKIIQQQLEEATQGLSEHQAEEEAIKEEVIAIASNSEASDEAIGSNQTREAMSQASSEVTPAKPLTEEQIEKENNGNHFNIMSSIQEDCEDNCRSASRDSLVSRLPPSSNSRNTLTSNKQNRRRSSERKETLREGLMRTSDFVVALKDLKCEHPKLWRITTGNNLLQQFDPKTQNGAVLYENTNNYSGWNPDIKRDYIGVDVKLTTHSRNQISVERLFLNFDQLDDAEAFYDKHFAVYIQILISTVLDPKFWKSIEKETVHHEYFMTSRRIIEDKTYKLKIKLSNKMKLNEATLKNFEKYPILLVKPAPNGPEATPCRACNITSDTQVVTFENRSYDLHSYKSVKVTSEPSKTDVLDLSIELCSSCVEVVKLYSEVHHMGWKFFNLARKKVDMHRAKGIKPINEILDECMKDLDWLATVLSERDALWSKVENMVK